jgi:hypothetical protein
MGAFQVKGSTMQYKVEFVARQRGESVAEDLKREFANDQLFPILDSRWYPFKLYDRLLVRTAELCFAGDIRQLEELSASWASKSLSGIYESYAWGQRLDAFLSRLPRLHDRMFTYGKVTTAKGELAGQHRITLSDSASYTAPVLYSASGFYLGATRFLGYPEASCSFTRSGSTVHFDLREGPLP